MAAMSPDKASVPPEAQEAVSVDSPSRLPASLDVGAPEMLALMAELSEEINASLDLDEVLAKAAAFIRRLIDYEVFAILLVDEERNDLYFRFSIGHRPEVVQNWRVPIGRGITGTAAATGRPLLVPDVREDPRYINALDSTRSELAVPLMVKGKCIGVLDIQSPHVNAFHPDHLTVLSLLATRLAIAIDNARLFEATRRQAETLLLLHEVARQASEVLEPEELLRRAAQLVKQVIDYQIFSLLLYDPEQKVFRHSVSVKFGQDVQERSVVPEGQGIVGLAARRRQPVLVPDVTRNPHYIRVNPETRSELAVPLISRNRVIGVIDLESPQPNYFTATHVQALSILAAHLAVAIENAQLYARVTRAEARMERELQAARAMQAALLPEVPAEDYGLDIAARYVSARELGGDIYDFRRYGPQSLAVALGDVSGKGAGAALYGAVAIGIFRSLAPLKLPPARMLRAMNRPLSERRIEGWYMTLCVATWHRGRRQLRVANAGQTQPLVVHAGQVGQLPLTGFPLGLGFSDAPYEELSLDLHSGDWVIFYSDGIVETMTTAGQLFGTERLRALVAEASAQPGLSADGMADRILAEVALASGSAAPADDRTLIVLKVK